MNNLQWKKYPVLNDGFVCLVDSMGDDSSIVQAARVSYGKDERKEEYETAACKICNGTGIRRGGPGMEEYECLCVKESYKKVAQKDRRLIRYLMSHRHTTPFEMVEFKFLVRVPMDCWRQWIRHRTASVNEYSTRYTEAIDSQQTTPPEEWRLQAKNNKQGSSGYLDENGALTEKGVGGEALSKREEYFHETARNIYDERLVAGVAKEQARKDLPLSTYTEAYWKINLHNLFHFLALRMDSHAQYEIRMYANALAEIVKQIVPEAWQAFEDYRLNACSFSAMEMEVLKEAAKISLEYCPDIFCDKPENMTEREWSAFIEKIR